VPLTNPTWRTATHQAALLTPAEQAILELTGRLPLAAVSQLLPLANGRSRSGLCSDVAHLAERGLIARIEGPPHGACRRRRLLLLTNLGLAVLACRKDTDSRELAHEWGLRRRVLDALVHQLPAVLNSYELLTLLAGARGGGKARLRAWQRPWRRRGSSGRPTRGVCLPAYADLEWCAGSGQRIAGEYVLVADTGGLPPEALRSQLGRLARLQFVTGSRAPVVAVATTSGRRVAAWSAVLDRIAAGRGGRLDSCIHTWDAWRAKGRAHVEERVPA